MIIGKLVNSKNKKQALTNFQNKKTHQLNKTI